MKTGVKAFEKDIGGLTKYDPAGSLEKNIAEYVINKLMKKGAQDVVISGGIDDSHQIKFVNNEIVAIKHWKFTDLGIFTIIDKKVIATGLKDLNKKSADQTVNKIFKIAKHLRPKDDWYGIAEGPFKYKNIPKTYDKRIAKIGTGGVGYIKKAIAAAHSSGAKRCSGVFHKGVGEDFIITSNSIETSDKGTSVELSIRSFAEKNASGHGISVARTVNSFDPEDAGAYSGKIAKKSLNPKTGRSGKFNILFDPLVFANILNQVADSTSIFGVESGFSFFKDRLNKKVANPLVTMYDDGTMPEGISSGKYDDEGTPAQKTTVIKNGILQTYLHNASTARKYKVKNTGNAGLINPSASNTVLKPGKYSQNSLMKQMKNGLWITNTWYTRFQNFEKGDFSTIPRDGIFVVKNGKVSHPISDIRISDNIINILNKVAAIGKDVKQIRGWEVESPVFTPSVLVKDVNITKSQG